MIRRPPRSTLSSSSAASDVYKRLLKAIRLDLSHGGAQNRQKDAAQDPPLDESQMKVFQSVAARLNYLSLDRPDLGFSVKELMRKMSAPLASDLVALKRCVRYLLSIPRLAYLYQWTPLSKELIIYADANWAGCLCTRKSTAGGVITWGGEPSRHGAKLYLHWPNPVERAN